MATRGPHRFGDQPSHTGMADRSQLLDLGSDDSCSGGYRGLIDPDTWEMAFVSIPALHSNPRTDSCLGVCPAAGACPPTDYVTCEVHV